MPYKQTKSVLEDVIAAHQELRDRCEQLCAKEPDDELSLLLDFLVKQEETFKESVKEYETETKEEGVLDTWIQFPSEEAMTAAFEQTEFRPAMSAQDIVAQILAFNERLLVFYRGLSNYADAPGVAALFADLAQLEEGKQRQYARLLQDWEYHM